MTLPLQLIPLYRDYVWGGQRLRPGQRTAEVWAVYEQNQIAYGPYTGKTLLDAVLNEGAALVGTRVAERTPGRFPLLIKLLDCADWLSLQVHPSDEQAHHLEGPDQFGKTEAWHIFEADPGAELLFGLVPHTTAAELETGMRQGTILDRVRRHAVHAGDTIFIRPGMIHALGPGLLLYEVQQTSNITYRVWDWNRPASDGRKLHIDQSLAVADLDAQAEVQPKPKLHSGHAAPLVECPYFTLELLALAKKPVHAATDGGSFHILTVSNGAVNVQVGSTAFNLSRFESVVIPADAGEYTLTAADTAEVLKAWVA